MKISELAKGPGFPRKLSTITSAKGVLRKPRKTGKNIADYNENYVEQIRIIKQLQEHYFLPLGHQENHPPSPEQSSSEKYSLNFLSEYFRPLDRLIAAAVTGREAFREATGLSAKWLGKFEEWGVIGLKCARVGRCMLRTTLFSAN